MAGGERKRLVISEDDLAQAPESEATAAHPPPLPRVQGMGATPRSVPVGTPQDARPAGAVAFTRTIQGRNVTAAVCGIAVGWAIAEFSGFANPSLGDSPFTQDLKTGAWTALVGVCFAVIYAGWESILARSGEGFMLAARRAGPSGAALAFASGFVAEIIYRHFVFQVLRSASLSDLLNLSSNFKLYLCRAVAWGLFGIGMGIAVAGGARAKLVNGVVGGALGGAAGGLVFHWATFNIHSGSGARFVGLAVVAIGIGLAIGVVEKARRDAWLQITGGPMAGKEFIVYDTDCTLGSSPKCALTLIKDPGVHPFHAAIRTTEESGRQVRVLDAYEGCPVTINGSPSVRHRLRSGDVIGLGAMTIAYSERSVT